jgi:tetratricopeptide (TPR) repeat protein
MNAVMEQVISSGVERWRQRFSEDAVVALDAALLGRMSLGQFDRARPSEALAQMLMLDEIPQADAAMQTWLEQHVGKPLPADLSPKRYADALVEAFRTIQLLPLPNTRNWCSERPGELRTWLRGFALGSSRDPEAAFLVALAHLQSNRSLMFTWYDVIRRGRPVEHVRHALMGLRLMPADDNGAEEHGLPRALLRGLLDYGETLVKSGDKKGKPWLEELDFLAAVYPMSQEKWSSRFRDILQARDVSKDVHNWLDSRFRVTRQDKTTAKGFLKPPHVDDMKPLLLRMQKDFASTRPALTALLDYHRHYTQESGDSFYLVRSFCNIGDKLLKHDPLWARELAHEAARWEPGNQHTWGLLARALEAEGDWRRAEAVYWNARRRFPHDVQRHIQLGHALLLHGQADLGETVFRQTIRLFPNDPFAWAELGHSLRVTGNYEQAVTVYREAQQQADFHRNPIIATALTDTLLDLNDLDRAKDALLWAEQIMPDDDRNQQTLAKIQRRFNQAKSGTPSLPRQLQKPKEIAGGNLRDLADITGMDLSHAPLLGRASLWRRQGNNSGLAQARTELNALQDSSAKLIELGLLVGVEQNWQAAAQWFDSCWENYAGDGALRVHRLRAKNRAGEEMLDWSWEKSQYPELSPVIITEEQGRSPHYHFHLPESELSEDQKQQLWFSGLAGDEQSILRDWVEEDFLTARQVA